MKPTILEALHHLSEHFGLSLTEVRELLRTPLHPHDLRDTFAGQAMQSLAVAAQDESVTGLENMAADMARACYTIADAMLEARLK